MKKSLLNYAGVLLIGLVVGYLLFGRSGAVDTHEGHAHTMADGSSSSGEEVIWTCSMHPQIRQSSPGKCPLCAMDLIPAASGSGSEDRYTMSMTQEAIKLAEIRTAMVVVGEAIREINMPGEVKVSEAGLTSVTAQFSGRVVSQRVDFVGRSVRRGEELVRIWSPEIILAQQELIDATGSVDEEQGLFAGTDARAMGVSMAEAARNKLRFWQLTEEQIAAIERDRVVMQQIPFYAPSAGVVLNRNVRVNDVIEPGMVLYEIADLSKVWIEFDVYERDLGLIREGARVRFGAGGLAGERMSGRVSWVDPIVDRERRAARVRVEADNRDGSWRPGMIVHGTLEVGLGGGKVLIPNSAVLWTGRRSLVYVASIEDDTWVFESREIVLGDRAGDHSVVLDGLKEGEHVVVNGAFKVDAEFQLRDKFSMMNRGTTGSLSASLGRSGDGSQPVSLGRSGNGSLSPSSAGAQGGVGMSGPNGISESGGQSVGRATASDITGIRRDVSGLAGLHGSVGQDFLVKLEGLLDGYFEIREALFSSNGTEAARRVNGMRQRLGSLDGRELRGQSQSIWLGYQQDLMELLTTWPDDSQLEHQRVSFYELSELLNEIVTRFGVQNVVYQQYCPMAFNDIGATWLSRSDRIENPYLPETMAGCGEVLVKIGG